MTQGKLIFGTNPYEPDNKIYDIVGFQIKTTRHYDAHCPDGIAKCEEIEVLLYSSQNTDNFLYEWYINQDAQSAHIQLTLDTMASNSLGDSEIREFKLEGALCYSLQDDYDIHFSQRHLTRLGIYVEQMTIEDIVFPD